MSLVIFHIINHAHYWDFLDLHSFLKLRSVSRWLNRMYRPSCGSEMVIGPVTPELFLRYCGTNKFSVLTIEPHYIPQTLDSFRCSHFVCQKKTNNPIFKWEFPSCTTTLTTMNLDYSDINMLLPPSCAFLNCSVGTRMKPFFSLKLKNVEKFFLKCEKNNFPSQLIGMSLRHFIWVESYSLQLNYTRTGSSIEKIMLTIPASSILLFFTSVFRWRHAQQHNNHVKKIIVYAPFSLFDDNSCLFFIQQFPNATTIELHSENDKQQTWVQKLPSHLPKYQKIYWNGNLIQRISQSGIGDVL